MTEPTAIHRTPKSSNAKTFGAAIGCSLGVLFLLSLWVAFSILRRRRRARRRNKQLHEEEIRGRMNANEPEMATVVNSSTVEPAFVPRYFPPPEPHRPTTPLSQRTAAKSFKFRSSLGAKLGHRTGVESASMTTVDSTISGSTLDLQGGSSPPALHAALALAIPTSQTPPPGLPPPYTPREPGGLSVTTEEDILGTIQETEDHPIARVGEGGRQGSEGGSVERAARRSTEVAGTPVPPREHLGAVSSAVMLRSSPPLISPRIPPQAQLDTDEERVQMGEPRETSKSVVNGHVANN